MALSNDTELDLKGGSSCFSEFVMKTEHQAIHNYTRFSLIRARRADDHRGTIR